MGSADMGRGFRNVVHYSLAGIGKCTKHLVLCIGRSNKDLAGKDRVFRIVGLLYQLDIDNKRCHFDLCTGHYSGTDLECTDHDFRSVGLNSLVGIDI